MHKNFRNSNKVHPIIGKIISKFSLNLAGNNPENSEQNLPILEREIIQNSIEKRVKLVGSILPIREDKIRKRLLNFLKKNRVSLRNEQSCCRHIKQFTAAAFLFCEVCEYEHSDLYWYSCKICGTFNNYKI